MQRRSPRFFASVAHVDFRVRKLADRRIQHFAAVASTLPELAAKGSPSDAPLDDDQAVALANVVDASAHFGSSLLGSAAVIGSSFAAE